MTRFFLRARKNFERLLLLLCPEIDHQHFL